jgi:hypothetical protein
MAWKSGVIGQARIKQTEAGPVTITSPGTAIPVVLACTAYAVGVNKQFNAVRAIFPFVKAGTGNVTVQVELQSDTGAGSAFQSLSLPSYVAGTAGAPTITPVGADAAHGAVVGTGPGIVEQAFDLDQVKVGTNLKIQITANFTVATTPTVTGTPLLEFFNAREEPPTSTTEATSA